MTKLTLKQWLKTKLTLSRSRMKELTLSQWLGFGIVIAVTLSLVLLADEKLLKQSIQKGIGGEPFKLVLQFLLITIAGGSFIALVNARKEKEASLEKDRRQDDGRRQAQMEAIQSLSRELSGAYRSMKRSRRRLRSRCDLRDPQRLHSKKDDFEACMDELLTAQISLEEVEDNIQISSALLVDDRYSRIRPALQYAARYLHDVFEDFEKGRVERSPDGYVLKSKNLRDFLLGSSEDSVYRDYFKKLYKSYKRSAQNLSDIEIEREKLKEDRVSDEDYYEYRYQKIAFQCVRTVAYELRAASSEVRFAGKNGDTNVEIPSHRVR